MCYFDVILLSDVISSIGPKISDADTYFNLLVNKFLSQIIFSGTVNKCKQQFFKEGQIKWIS